ncbi:MAG: type IV toxin-antitoxin system AbiEi family antitoxin domain-containing protein [Nocardioides sp.]
MNTGLTDSHGILLRRSAIERGIDDDALKRLVRGGLLVRIRQGAYADAAIWAQANATHRHRLLTRAVLALYGDHVALSHASATVAYGGPDWGLDLRDVHVTHLDGRAQRSAGRVVHHRGECRVDDISRLEEWWITSPARTALDTAAAAPRDSAVCVLDWYLEQQLVTRDQLLMGHARMSRWPDTLGLYRAIHLADGKAQSVLETRTRLLCHDSRLPAPEAQFIVMGPLGEIIGIVDFAWPERKVMVEVDGREKYLKFRRPGESIEDAVLREKVREDRLRESTGWLVVRLSWADIEHRPQAAVARIERAFRRAAA